MTTDEYRLSDHSGDPAQARALVILGWIPSAAAAVIAGIVAALVEGDPWLFPVVAVAGVLLGSLATLAAWVVVGAADLRWHLLGPWSPPS